MDNGDSFLDVIDDTRDLFGDQNESNGSLFAWADEILGDEAEISSSTVALESGNLATNVNQPNLLLTTQNYAVTSSIPTQNISLSTSQYLSKSTAGIAHQKSAVVAQTLVNPSQSAGVTTQIVQQGNQHFIVRTPSGGQLQLNRQAQFQQQVLQPQQNISGTNSPLNQLIAQPNASHLQSNTVMNRSQTPNSSSLSFGGSATVVTQSITRTRSSPAPNVNLVHLPPNVQLQQQQHVPQQQQQQFQIAPGTILQIPTGSAGTGQNLVNTTLLQQGQQILGNAQQGTLVNAQNTVIQNPNVVNVNVAAQHVLCSNSNQQQRSNIGLTNIQAATPSPFNIQGTLIQTAEGKSILIPSQNIAQPINIQSLSVATPLVQPQIQQPAQNTVANMLQIAQPQQQPQQQQQQGVQQIVLNHQGQQILVQRAQTPGGQPQNIFVRTAGGQSGIVQLQQRTAQTAPVQSAQQTLQALAAGSGNQQLKIVNQQGTAQTGVPVINIGGQNVTLQQLSSQLGNIQGLQVQQSQSQIQQQHPQQQQIQNQQLHNQQQNLQHQQQLQNQQLQQQQLNAQSQLLGQRQHNEQLGFQGQNLQNQITSGGQVTYNSQGHLNVQGHVGAQLKINSSQGQLNQAQTNTSVNSVENQTRLILQQIHDNLKKSQASTMNSVSATVSNIQASQIKKPVSIKQEFSTNDSGTKSFLSSVMSSAPVKTEANLIETLIKQENNPRTTFIKQENTSQSCLTSQATTVRDLLSNNAQTTCGTTTVSQVSTQMSLFVLPNTQTVQSNAGTLVGQTSLSSGLPDNQGLTANVNNSAQNTSAVPQGTQSVNQQGQATLQTIHLPPELQQQFQRVQLEIQKVKAATHLTQQQKQEKLQHLTIFQKRILLKGRVLATTKADPNQIQQGSTNLNQSSMPSPGNISQNINSSIAQLKSSVQASSASSPLQSGSNQFSPAPSNQGLKNLLGQEDAHNQPDSTSSLGQVSHSANSLPALLGSPSSSTDVNQQMQSTNQVGSVSQQMLSSNQRIPTSVQNVTPPTQSSATSLSTTSTTTASGTPQVAVPTQIKIADKVLTLSLTPAQKDKVQSYLDRMTPDQQVQYLQTQQHVLQRIQKQQALNAQIRAQVEAQKQKQAVLTGQGQPTGQQNVQGTVPTTAEGVDVKPEVKTIPVPNTSINTRMTDTPQLRAPKRSYMDIPKGTLINQQIKQDQNHAVNPDTKRPFRSRGDACRRLLRYHVFQKYGPSEGEFTKFDNYMEDISEDLLKKKDRMFERFRHLLYQETLRVQPSSELVMLQRMQNQDLRKVVEEEKQQIKDDPESFTPMPLKYLNKDESKSDPVADQDTVLKSESTDDSDVVEESEDPVTIETDKEVVHAENSMEEVRAAKMRKLVIKTEDGMNFKSSFKRISLDSSRSSIDERREVLAESDSNNSDNEGDCESPEKADTVITLDDDEDTNEYANDKFDKYRKEAEQAALAISSAEESQDSQLDSRLDMYNIDNSLSQHSGQSSGIFYQSESNFELASESIQSSGEMSQSKDSKHFSRHSSVEESKTYIPRNSASVSSGSLLEGITNYPSVDDSDTEDKFDMYQPITESLTDSEENSYYSADNTADQKSVMIDDDDDLHQGHWNKKDVQNIPVDSDQESDQEVKAQMESAINSILSLSQSASNEPDTVYSYSQSNQFFNPDSQPNSLYNDPSDLQATLDFQTDQSQMSMEVTADDDDHDGNLGTGEISSDLDAAVNSILM